MKIAPTALSATHTQNRLLAALPVADFAEIARDLHPVVVCTGDVLQHAHQPVRTLWFPGDCLVSLRADVDSGAGMEVALAGNEGVIGMAGIGDGGTQPDAGLLAVVQLGGSAMQIDAGILRKLLAHSIALQQMLFGAMRDLMLQASRNAVCSHYHLLEARVARSLLRMRDRVQRNEFHMTHEFLAHALGVRRVGVTKAASALQSHGLIRYTRGDITIMDGVGLERAACACYATDQRHLPGSHQKLSE